MYAANELTSVQFERAPSKRSLIEFKPIVIGRRIRIDSIAIPVHQQTASPLLKPGFKFFVIFLTELYLGPLPIEPISFCFERAQCIDTGVSRGIIHDRPPCDGVLDRREKAVKSIARRSNFLFVDQLRFLTVT
ncbi:hypothetical protein AQ708_17995 [Burkholderia pseudomallei]|nr:hypothetical protein AQ708_17995 [Burkholderia pseudomallei]